MRRLRVVLLLVVAILSLSMTTASGFWTALSVAGGSGAAASASVNQGATPVRGKTGREVTLSWAPSTLSNGLAVAGYEIKRYTSGTLVLQTIRSACSGTITGTSCVESGVPTGQWVYSVTPLFAANWRGPESLKSSAVTIDPSTLSLSVTTLRPGTSVTGTAGGFAVGETLRYRLDSPTGPAGVDLSGSLAGSPTPATVPGSGGGAASIAVPPGTSDGAHTIYAVAQPSGEAAEATIIVDGTPPPVPVLTKTPGLLTGQTFHFTEAEVTATVQCRIDGAPFTSCTSPVTFTGLGLATTHTFDARAVDTVGNVSAVTSHTWTVLL